jgi:hypothetical protein
MFSPFVHGGQNAQAGYRFALARIGSTLFFQTATGTSKG